MRAARYLRALSDGVALVEGWLLRLLIAAVAVLVLANVATRPFGVTLAWADEVAVQSMILAGFVGASLMFRLRRDPAVLLLHEALPARGIAALRVAVSALSLAFALLLGWTCWLWLDLPNLIRAGFDVPRFEAMTFNFIYTEQTPVLGLPAIAVFAVMPWFAATLTIHALTNLIEDAGLLPRPDSPRSSEGPAI